MIDVGPNLFYLIEHFLVIAGLILNTLYARRSARANETMQQNGGKQTSSTKSPQ